MRNGVKLCATTHRHEFNVVCDPVKDMDFLRWLSLPHVQLDVERLQERHGLLCDHRLDERVAHRSRVAAREPLHGDP